MGAGGGSIPKAPKETDKEAAAAAERERRRRRISSGSGVNVLTGPGGVLGGNTGLAVRTLTGAA
jgi:hypothetical protein